MVKDRRLRVGRCKEEGRAGTSVGHEADGTFQVAGDSSVSPSTGTNTEGDRVRKVSVGKVESHKTEEVSGRT